MFSSRKLIASRVSPLMFDQTSRVFLYEPTLAENGMKVSGRSPDGKFVEIAELPSHPWFVAVQFHPEFQSRPLRPHPLFASFVGAALQHKNGTLAPVSVSASGR